MALLFYYKFCLPIAVLMLLNVAVASRYGLILCVTAFIGASPSPINFILTH